VRRLLCMPWEVSGQVLVAKDGKQGIALEGRDATLGAKQFTCIYRKNNTS